MADDYADSECLLYIITITEATQFDGGVQIKNKNAQTHTMNKGLACDSESFFLSLSLSLSFYSCRYDLIL